MGKVVQPAVVMVFAESSTLSEAVDRLRQEGCPVAPANWSWETASTAAHVQRLLGGIDGAMVLVGQSRRSATLPHTHGDHSAVMALVCIEVPALQAGGNTAERCEVLPGETLEPNPASARTEPATPVDPEDTPSQDLVWMADKIDAILGEREHSTAVARWAEQTAARLGLDRRTQLRTAAAGRLHDVGKICVDESLLAKPGRLTADEWVEMRRHPDEGARLLVEMNRPDLAPLVAAHHERYDGTGYPRGLAGADIPIEARIIAVCDAWATMRVDRPYARALGVGKAREELETGRSTQFDPRAVNAFLELVDEGAIDEPALLSEYTSQQSAGRGHF
ncbi:HD-GYP domain-containing protein [Catellatospora sp. NPDC049609]|uniref:HD-GYP domain-containing protein n=1 Tax=Catellatospora sp. NPDC049609 TaxID=3155505 RepID=UPI003445BC2C